MPIACVLTLIFVKVLAIAFALVLVFNCLGKMRHQGAVDVGSLPTCRQEPANPRNQNKCDTSVDIVD
jgi:hypothetical protein